MSYSLVYTDHFNDCVREYQQRDARYLAELMQVVMDLARQPFNNPSLQTHSMKGVTGEKRFISYVGGSKGTPTGLVPVQPGHRAAALRRARRRRTQGGAARHRVRRT